MSLLAETRHRVIPATTFHIPQFCWLLNGVSSAHPYPSRLAFRISKLWLFGAKDGKDTFCLRWQIWFQWLPRRQQISWKLCVGALMSIKVIREKCPSQAELLKTKSWQAFSLPWVNGVYCSRLLTCCIHRNVT